jgi:hypothetical protein
VAARHGAGVEHLRSLWRRGEASFLVAHAFVLITSVT